MEQGSRGLGKCPKKSVYLVEFFFGVWYGVSTPKRRLWEKVQR